LALRVAGEAQRAFPNGTWLVKLATLQDGELLAQTVTAALGLVDRSPWSPMDTFLEFVHDKTLLLVLDNCEHLLDACAGFVGRLLGSAAGARVVATSRQPLGVGGEFVLGVPPLSVPDPGRPVTAGAFEEYEAMRLFVERANAAAPDLPITSEDRETVARLCRRLDGIPLAIELAVVRLRSLTPEQVLDRLDDRFRLLTGGDRAALPRQQTMRAAIDWSFELCSPEERTLWGRLSVFAGGFDLDAAESLCHDATISSADVVDLVAGLVDKSILIREPHGVHVRYRMSETIHEYGRRLLAKSGEEGVLRRRHWDFYRDRMAQAGEAWFGPHQGEWYERLRLDHSNVRAALGFCLTEAGGERKLFEIITTNWDYWIFCGLLGETRRRLELALERDRTPTADRAKALWVAGRLAILQGDTAGALALIRECRSVAERVNDASALAHAIGHLGVLEMYRGNHERAVSLLEEARDRHREAHDPPGIRWMALYRLALAVTSLGDAERAAALGEEALRMSEAHRADVYRSLALWLLGSQRYQHGDLRQATALISESLRLQRSFNDLWNTARCMEALAWVATARGLHEYAARVFGAADTLWRSLGSSLPGYPPFVASHEACEAELRRALGDAFTAAFQDGAEFTLDEAIAYALDEKTDVSTQKLPEAPSVLTRRERQVAELVAQGLSNKDIAAALVIAQRTAEGHVERILAKLGFTSRTQIASWAAKRDEEQDT
jgi:non-specific serine/threonine protein kinase